MWVVEKIESKFVLPRHFKSSEQSNASQHWQAERRHDVGIGQDKLQDTADHNEAVETIEKRYKITLQNEKKSGSIQIIRGAHFGTFLTPPPPLCDMWHILFSAI